MTEQIAIDFVHTRENNKRSQKILDNNRVRLSSQVAQLMTLLAKGYPNEQGIRIFHIDFATAYNVFNIGDLRRRICDIQDKFYINVERRYDENGKATYYLTEENRIKAMQILNKIKDSAK